MRYSMIALLLAATAMSPALAGPKGKDHGGGHSAKPQHQQQQKADKPQKAHGGGHAEARAPQRRAQQKLAQARVDRPAKAKRQAERPKPASHGLERAERRDVERLRSHAGGLDRHALQRAAKAERKELKRVAKAERRDDRTWRDRRADAPLPREVYGVVTPVVRYAPEPRAVYVAEPVYYYPRRTITYAPVYYDAAYGDWYDDGYGYADPYDGYAGYSPWDYQPLGFGDDGGLFGSGGGLIEILLPVLLQGVLGGDLGGGLGTLGGLGGLLGAGYADAPHYGSPVQYAGYDQPFAAPYDYGYADPYGYDPYGYPYEPMDPYAYGDPLGGDLLSGGNLAGLVLPALLSGGEPSLFI